MQQRLCRSNQPGWATPGVHPALGLDALPSGVEEAILTRPGLLPTAPALMVEGINSNLAAPQHGQSGRSGLARSRPGDLPSLHRPARLLGAVTLPKLER